MVSVDSKIIVDSGASYHCIGEDQIEDKNAVYRIPNPIDINTANGIVRITKAATVWSDIFQDSYEAYVLKGAPTHLSLGLLIKEKGNSFKWTEREWPSL